MISSYHDHKRYLLMNIINHLGAVSRTELAELTGYQPAAVSAITRQLLSENILVETGTCSSGPGRKRILLQFNTQNLCAIAVSFTAQEVTFVTAQLDGKVLSSDALCLAQYSSEASLAEDICNTIRHLLDTLSDRCFTGIGLCTPTNDSAAYPLFLPSATYRRLEDWIRYSLKQKLAEAFSIPIEVFFGSTLAALVEYNLGQAKGIQDFICVELTNGIGCSLFCDGKAFTGARGVAGEIGHTVIDRIDADTELCYCGKLGCVEQKATLPYLVQKISASVGKQARSFLPRGKEEITAADICRATEAGDRLCCHYVKQIASSLGVAIGNAAMLINPSVIILYGHMLALGEFFLNHLKNEIIENVSHRTGLTQKDILVSPELETKLPLGAISELFSLYLKKNDFLWVYRLPDTQEKAVILGEQP